MDNIRKLKSKTSTGTIYFDIINEGSASHTLFSRDFKKVSTFTIGEWYSGISDLYEVVAMKPEEEMSVLDNLKIA